MFMYMYKIEFILDFLHHYVAEVSARELRLLNGKRMFEIIIRLRFGPTNIILIS